MRKFLRTPAIALLLLGACRSAPVQPQAHTRPNISISAEIPDDAATDAVIAPYKQSMERQMDARISHTATDLTKDGDNSSLGSLLADYTLQGARDWAARNKIPQPEAAVINIGGIRSTIGKGDILLKHIYEVMPFENELVIIKMKGAALQGLFDYYAATRQSNPVAGLYIETDGKTLVKGLVGGLAPDPQKDYYIATSDYLALGGDNMNFFGQGEMISTGLKLRDVFVEKFRANPEVAAPADVRLVFKNKKQ